VNYYIGEIAALGTSLCWTLTSIFFTISGRRVGAVIVNRVRLVMAVVLLAITHFLTQGQWLPIQAGLDRWFWLGLSGVIGLALGDGFLFHAFVLIGPRRSTLLMSLVPIISAVIAWLFLGERLSPTEMLAVGLTVGGIAWVVLEKGGGDGTQSEPRRYWLGVLAGMGGSLGQAMGLVLSKKGMGGDFAPLSATLIRMVMAAVVIWSYALLRGRAGYTLKALTDKRASLATLGGAITGPFIGVWLSLVAVQSTRVGIASTLMALPPIFVLLPSIWIFRERIGPRAIIGTLVAIGGVATLFLV
jgi:drug/metabolite transporter (DMT)-like permease